MSNETPTRRATPLPDERWSRTASELRTGPAPIELLLRFRCIACGYGVSCRVVPQRCPMCGGTAWHDEPCHPRWDRDQPLQRDVTL
jgi:rubrerythrin